MALAINGNFAAIAGGALTAMKSNQGLMGKSITRISTGSKLSTNDNASALISSNKIKADADGYRALYSGIQSGSAKLNAASTAANSMLDILSSMKSKAIEYSAANGNSDAQSAIQSEFNALKSAYSAVSNTKYEGKTIWNSVSFTLGMDGTTVYEDTEISKYGYITSSGTGQIGLNGQSFIIMSDTSRCDDASIVVNGNNIVVGTAETGTGKITWNALGRAQLNNGSYYSFSVNSSTGIITGGYGAGSISSNTLVINGTKYDVSGNTISLDGNSVGYVDTKTDTSVNVAFYNTNGAATAYTASVNTPDSADKWALTDTPDKFQTRIDTLTSNIATMNAGSAALSKISDYMQNMAAAQDAAYETIADADMAAEMTQHAKSNVLSQAAQAMISQANQSMAQVLNLLQ